MPEKMLQKMSQALSINVQWKDETQWSQNKTQDVPSEHQETAF